MIFATLCAFLAFGAPESSSSRIELTPTTVTNPIRPQEGMTEGYDLSRLAFRMRAPWMTGSVELRFPEVYRSSLGCHFMDHYRSDIAPIAPLDPWPEWKLDTDSGAMSYSFELPKGVIFEAHANPGADVVDLKFTVRNATDAPISHAEPNCCLDLKGSPEFNHPWDITRLYAVFNGALRPLSETTPTPAQMGRQPWLTIHAPGGRYKGTKDTGVSWWLVDQQAEENLMAAIATDSEHIIGYTWDIAPELLMSNCGNPCLHTGAGPSPVIAPGESHTWHGKVYFHTGTVESLLARYKSEQANVPHTGQGY